MRRRLATLIAAPLVLLLLASGSVVGQDGAVDPGADEATQRASLRVFVTATGEQLPSEWDAETLVRRIIDGSVRVDEVQDQPEDYLFPTRDIVVAMKEIEAGRTIEPEWLTVRPVPIDDTTAYAYSDPADVVGWVPAVDILQFQPVTPNLLQAEAAAAHELVGLPQAMKADVPGARGVRWFEVRGNSVDRLLEMTVKRSRPSCGGTDMLACVDGSWTARPTRSFDRRTGRCTVTGLFTSHRMTAYLPRWAGPAEVDPDVLTWWRGFLGRLASHEARHIEILSERLVGLKEQLVGEPCRRVNGIMRRWEKGTEQAQQAFDASEQEIGLP